jgi:hypothetical protein
MPPNDLDNVLGYPPGSEIEHVTIQTIKVRDPSLHVPSYIASPTLDARKVRRIYTNITSSRSEGEPLFLSHPSQ